MVFWLQSPWGLLFPRRPNQYRTRRTKRPCQQQGVPRGRNSLRHLAQAKLAAPPVGLIKGDDKDEGPVAE